MNKANLILVLSVISIFFLTGCDVYESLYGEEVEFLELENISVEVDKTLEEILPTEVGEVEVPEEEVVILPEAEEEVEVEILPTEGGEEEVPEEEVVILPEEGMIEAEEEEAELGEEAVVITVKETDLISLVPEAEDPDKDKLLFTFSSPLDEMGEWQTTYGDAGEYTVTITASDGQLTTSQDILIIVSKKEEMPAIESFKPKETAIELMETESIDFNIEASDLNKDKLSYSWKFDGFEVSDDKAYNLKTTYDDSGSHTIKVDISDGLNVISQLWSVTVENVNRKPILEEILSIKVKERETVTISPEVNDPDGDQVSFTISDPVGDDGIWETTYDDSGEYTVTVTASDGTDSVSQDVKIVVDNVNRPPVITGIVQKT